MLQTLRDSAKSWVVKILLGLLVVSFGVWGIADWMVTGGGVQNVATVGNRAISGTEYTQALQRVIDSEAQRSGNRLSLEDARALGIDKQVRDNLIATAALDDMGDRLGIYYGAKQVVEETQTNPAFLDGAGRFDASAFRAQLANAGFSEQEFVASEQANRTREALTSAADLAVAPKTLVDAQNLFAGETRQAKYAVFSVKEVDIPAPSETELAEYFKQNAALYVDPEFRSAAIMKVEPQDIASKIQVGEAEITEAYKRLAADYFQPERRTLLQLSFPDESAAKKAKDRLAAGEDFMTIANEMGAKPTDVTLEKKTKADLFDPVIADAAFALAKDEVSEPVKGGLAIVLLKVTEISPERQPPLEEIRSQLLSRLQFEKAREELQAVNDAVEDARASQTKFEDIAEKAGIPLSIVVAVSQAGLDPKGQQVMVPGGADTIKALFNSDVGVDNDAIHLAEGFIWYDVREVIPSQPMKLENVKDRVAADWKASKLRTAAEDKAKALVEAIKGGKTLEAVAAELATTVKETGLLKRNEASEEFDGASVAALFRQPEGGITYALEGNGTSAKVIVVAKVTPPSMTQETQTKQAEEAALQGLRGDLMQAYLAAVRNGSDVEINEELWQRIDGGNTSQTQ